MAYNRLNRPSDQRKAMLRSLATALINNGKIVTTEAKAKEVKKIAEGLIAMAVKEKDNFEMVKVQAKVPVKDKDGKRVKEVVDGKKVTKFETVEKEIKKDMPSRLHARRQMLKVLCPVTEVPAENAGKKKVKNFSLGMKQRLGIAIALAGDPDFLVLDEPINGLDPQGIVEIRELILKLNREKQITILISSHILDELSRVATCYGIIDNGRMVKEISAAELEMACRKCVHIEVTDTKI